MREFYVVESGWITFHQFGDRVEERRSDEPDEWEFTDYHEAREAFEQVAADLARAYRTERQCSGRAWREMDAYATLEARDEVEDENGEQWCEFVQLGEARYGLEEWERDHPEE